MELNKKEIKKLSVLALVLILAVLVFFLIKPILLSILGGLILGYIFFPIHKRILKKVKSRNLAATITTLIAIFIIVLPLWFIMPPLINQAIQLFANFQTLDIATYVQTLFPTATDQFIIQMTTTFNSFLSKIASSLLSFLVNVFLELPTFLLHLFLIAFVFFFALRDGDKLKSTVAEISPLDAKHEKVLVDKFKGITDSIIYGQIIVGLVQGIVAGIGFVIFGIPNALLLTATAVILGVIPVLGQVLIWIPVSIYLLLKGEILIAILFIAYNIFIVSTVDNILRTYIVAKYTDISVIIIFIGMIGGLFVFGILGLILGPLILTYFITFLKAYKESSLGNLFKE